MSALFTLSYRTSPDTLDDIRADLNGLLANSVELMSITPPASLNAARALWMRQALEAAADHAAALMPLLDVPRLVEPDMVAFDRDAAREALDAAVVALDAMDGDPEAEDGGDAEWSLGWTESGPRFCGGYEDRELDTADAEPSLASPERHPDVPVVTWGPAWTARGGDESQLRWAEGARDDRERAEEEQPHDDDELDGAGEVDAEASIGWPEDFTAEVSTSLEATFDAEADDADAEDDELGDDRDPEPVAWVFGPSRREGVHA